MNIRMAFVSLLVLTPAVAFGQATVSPGSVGVDRSYRLVVSAPGVNGSTTVTGSSGLMIADHKVLSADSLEVWVLATSTGSKTLTLTTGGSVATGSLDVVASPVTDTLLENIDPVEVSTVLDPTGPIYVLGPQPDDTTLTLRARNPAAPPPPPSGSDSFFYTAYVNYPDGGTEVFESLSSGPVPGDGEIGINVGAVSIAPVPVGSDYTVYVQVQNTTQLSPSQEVLSYTVTRAPAGALRPGRLFFKEEAIGHDAAPSLGLRQDGHFDFKAAVLAGEEVTVTAWLRLSAHYLATSSPLPQLTVSGPTTPAATTTLAATPANTWQQVSVAVTPANAETLTLQVRGRGTDLDAVVLVDDLAVNQTGGTRTFAGLPPIDPTAAVQRTDQAEFVRSIPHGLLLRGPVTQDFKAALAGGGMLRAEAFAKTASGNPNPQISLVTPSGTLTLQVSGDPDEDGWTRYLVVGSRPTIKELGRLRVAVANGELALDDLKIEELPLFYGFVDAHDGPEVEWRWAQASTPPVEHFRLFKPEGAQLVPAGPTLAPGADHVHEEAAENTLLTRYLEVKLVSMPPTNRGPATVVTPIQVPTLEDLTVFHQGGIAQIMLREPNNGTLGQTGVEVLRADNSSMANPVVVQAFGATYALGDATASPAYYQIRYRNRLGLVGPSSPAVLATALPAPVAQTNDFQVFPEQDSLGVLIRAEIPSYGSTNGARLVVERASDAGFTTGVQQIPVPPGSYTVRDRSGAGTFHYRVAYVDPVGSQSPFTTSKPATPGLNVPATPASPTATVIASTADTVTLRWSWPNSGGAGYRLFDVKDNRVVGTVTGGTFVEETVPRNASLSRAVVAFSGGGANSSLSTIGETVTPFADPGANALDAAFVSTDKVRVSALRPPGATPSSALKIERSISGDFSDSVVVFDGSDTGVAFDTLPSGTTTIPSYRVSYRNDGGTETAPSSAVQPNAVSLHPTIAWTPAEPGGANAPILAKKGSSFGPVQVQLIDLEGRPVTQQGATVFFEIYDMGDDAVTAEFADGNPAGHTWQVQATTDVAGIATSPRVEVPASSNPGFLSLRAVCELNGRRTTLTRDVRIYDRRLRLIPRVREIRIEVGNPAAPLQVDVVDENDFLVSGFTVDLRIEDPLTSFLGQSRVEVVSDGAGVATSPIFLPPTVCGDTRISVSAGGISAINDLVEGSSVALAVDPAASAGAPTQLVRLHEQDMLAPAGSAIGELLYQVRDSCDRPVPGVLARVYNYNSISPTDGTPRRASSPPRARLPQRTDQFSEPIPANFGGPLAVARAFHSTTLFEPGKVLVVGGSTKHGAAASETAQANLAPTALILDFNACATQELSSQRARKDHTATLLENGTVLIVGGVDSAGAIVPSQIYDPSTGVLADAPALLPSFPRHSHSAIPFGGGVLLVGGLDASGTRVRRAEVLGPNGASVSSFDLPDEDRIRAALVVFQKTGSSNDQKILVIGSTGASVPANVLALDVTAQTVTTLETLPEIAPSTTLAARQAVSLARDERDADQGKVLLVGDNGAAIFDPEVSFSLSDTTGDSSDPVVQSFGGLEFGLARVPSALPSSALDRILLVNDRGDSIFYSRDDLGVQANSRFFATASLSGGARATGFTVTQLDRNSGYERTLGSALFLGGASAVAPDDANVVLDDAVAFVAPWASLAGPGTGGFGLALTLVSDAAGIFRVQSATLQPTGGRHTIRIETTPAPGANRLVSFTNLYGKDPLKKSPAQGSPSGGGGGGGEPPPPPFPPPPLPPPGGGSLPLFSLDCPCKGAESELALHIPEGVLAEKVELITVAMDSLGTQSGPDAWLEAVCAPGFQPGGVEGHGITITNPELTDLAGEGSGPELFVRLDQTLSPDFQAGDVIALSRIVGGNVVGPDACPTDHLHGTFNPDSGNGEIFIDDRGPFADPAQPVCGYGQVFAQGPEEGEAPALPELLQNEDNSRITIVNPSPSEPLRAGTYTSRVRTTQPETLVGVVMKITDFEGNETFCPLVTSVRCVDIEINSGQPLLLDRNAIAAGIAAKGGNLEAYAKSPACFTWVSGTYVHNTPEIQLYIDEFPAEAIWAGEPDPCCLVVLETTEHFVFDNGKNRKVLTNSCDFSPYRIKERLIPVGPVAGQACVRAFLIPSFAAPFFANGIPFVNPFTGSTFTIPPPPLSGEPCDEACTCLLGGQIWICDKDETTDDVLVTSDQNDTLADFGNVACPGTAAGKKECKEANTLVIQLDGDEECCMPVEVRIQNTGTGKASFQPCFPLQLVQKVAGCGGARFKIPLWGLKESCEKGDVKISISVGSATLISVGGGGFSTQTIGEEFPCLNKPCPPTVEATVLGIRSQVCATPDPCDDLVPLPVGTNPPSSTELNVCLIGPSDCTYDICIDQSGGGAVAFSLDPSGAGGTANLILTGVQAIPPPNCGPMTEPPPIPENATRTRSPGPGSTGTTTRSPPSSCPASNPRARKVYMVGTSKSGSAFDTAVNLRLIALDRPCPDKATIPERTSRPVTGSQPRVPTPPLATVTRPPPPPCPGETLLSRCEDITVPSVELLICGTTGDDDDLGCANPGTQVPITVRIDPSIKDLCPNAKPFTLEYVSTIGGTLVPGGSPVAVNEETSVAATGFGGPSASADDQEVVLKRTCGDLTQELAREDFTVLQGTLGLPECVCESGQTLNYTFEMEPKTGWDAGRFFTWTFQVTSGQVLMNGSGSHTITMLPTAMVTEQVVSGGGSADVAAGASVVEARTAICGMPQGCGSDTTTVVGAEVEKKLPNNCLAQSFQPKGQVIFKLQPQRFLACDFDVDLMKGENADQPLDAAESGAITFTTTRSGDRIIVDLEAVGEIGGKREFKLRCFNVAAPTCFTTATILFGNDYDDKPARNCQPGDPATLAAGGAKGSGFGDMNDSADPVDLSRGELMLTRVDMVIPGRGMDFQHVRSYRSRSDRDTCQGYGWDFNFNTRLPQLAPGTTSRSLIEGGTNIASTFPITSSGFETPPTIFASLREITPGRFRILDRDGTARFFDSVGHLTSIVDVHGNTIEFFYGAAGDPNEPRDVLTRVRDTLGRDIRYVYHPGDIGGAPRLHQLIDFTGRSVTYQYTPEGDLRSVTTPRVTTPDNHFANGKTESYTYLTGQGVPDLNHNMETITRPNQNTAPSERGATDSTPTGTAVTQITYDPLDRVQTEFWGSGTLTYNYVTGPSAQRPATAEHDEVVRITEVTDRNGNRTDYWISAQNLVTVKREFVAGGRVFETKKVHDQNNQLIRETLPRGAATVRVYDDGKVQLPNGPVVTDPRLTANAIVTVVIPATGLDAEGNYTIENDHEFLIMAAVWDNIYNKPCIQFEPRSFATAAELGPVLPSPLPQSQRYASRVFFDYEEGDPNTQVGQLATKLGTSTDFVQGLLSRNDDRVIPQIKAAILALTTRDVDVIPPTLPTGVQTDFNEDGVVNRVVGDHVLVRAPDVSLTDEQINFAGVDGESQQEAYSTTIYNAFGQATSTTDAEGNTTSFVYFAATNPTGAAGGAADVVRPGADLTTGGHLERVTVDTTLPSGMPAGRRRVGAPASVNLVTSIRYNRRGAEVAVTDPRGNTTTLERNELDQVVRAIEPAPYSFITRFVYDANDNQIETHVEDRRANTAVWGGPAHDGGHNTLMGPSLGFFVHTTTYNILDNVVSGSEDARAAANVAAPKALTTALVLDPNQNVERTIHPRGNETARTFDARDLLETARAGLGAGSIAAEVAATRYTYDATKASLTTIDAQDQDVVTVRYDGLGRVKRVIDPLGNETVTFRDAAGHPYRIVRRGQVRQGAGPLVDLSEVQVRFDERKRPYQEDKLLYFATGVAPPAPAGLGSEGPLTPGDGAVSVRFSFDRSGRLVAGRDDDNDVDRMSYDGANRLIHAIDAEKNETTNVYDGNSNLVRKVERDADAAGSLPAEAFTSHYHYDVLNRRTSGIDNLGNEAKTAHDSRGNLTHTVDPLGNVVRFDYDGANRITETVRVLKVGGRGRLSPTDLTNTANPDGEIRVGLRYDDNGNLTRLVDDAGNETSFVFDAHDRLRRTVYPNGTVETMEYDLDHKVVSRTDANGTVFTTGYDPVNRAVSLSITRATNVRIDNSPTGDPTDATVSGITNVLGTMSQTFAYDGLSRMVEITDSNRPGTTEDDATCALVYDSLSRVVAESQTIGSVTRTVSYGWEFYNEQRSLRYPNGRVVERVHDALDRVTRISDQGGSLLADFRYLGGRVVESNYGNGTRLTHLNDARTQDLGYDGLRRATQRRYTRAGDNSLVVGFEQGYDSVSNRVFERKLHDPDQSERWKLDSAYRLSEFERGTLDAFSLGQQAVVEPADRRPSILGTPARRDTWQLDGNGSWRSGTETTPAETVSYTRSTSPRHEYTAETRTTVSSVGTNTVSRTFLNDPAGNLVDDGRLVYRWDGLNRLAQVENQSGNVIARYAYDAQGRRVRKEVTAAVGNPDLEGVTLYFHDGGQILEELFRAPGQTQFALMRQFTYGLTIDEPCTIDRYAAGAGSAPLDPTNLTSLPTGAGPTGVHRLFYSSNTLGSVFALTDTQAASPGIPGARIVEAQQYDAYGVHTQLLPGGGSTSVTFGAGDLTATDARSVYDNPFLFTGRYFDAETGLLQYRNRYYDAKLGRFLSVDPAGYAEGLNPYEYVGGNPHNMVDPSGATPVHAAAAATGAVVGGTMSFVSTIATGGSFTDAAIEGGIGAVEGGLMGGLTCGLPPPAPYIISTTVGSVLRTSIEEIRRMIECGVEFDLVEFLEKIAKNVIRDLLLGKLGDVLGAGGKRLAAKLGLDDVLKRASPCVKGAAMAGLSVGASAAMRPLTNCFLQGTPIETEDGAKSIEDVQAGDLVVARNDKTGEQGLKRVNQVFRNTTQKVVTVEVARVDPEPAAQVRKGPRGRTERRGRSSSRASGDEGDGLAEPPSVEAKDSWTIECTPGHPWRVRGRGWVLAGALEPGQLLRGVDGEVLEVVAVHVENREAKTFNFEVEDWHTYFAGGVWVHNTSGPDVVANQGLVLSPSTTEIKNGSRVPVQTVTNANGGTTKIYGKAQVTRAPGGQGKAHGVSSLNEAAKMAASGDYDEVWMNRSWKKATDGLTSDTTRPDVLGKTKGGKWNAVEVPSAIDLTPRGKKALDARVNAARSSLPAQNRGTYTKRKCGT